MHCSCSEKSFFLILVTIYHPHWRVHWYNWKHTRLMLNQWRCDDNQLQCKRTTHSICYYFARCLDLFSISLLLSHFSWSCWATLLPTRKPLSRERRMVLFWHCWQWDEKNDFETRQTCHRNEKRPRMMLKVYHKPIFIIVRNKKHDEIDFSLPFSISCHQNIQPTLL